MYNFVNIKSLDKHFEYLSNVLNDKDIFLVGGCVRDLLLGITSDPEDLDLTIGKDPEKVLKNIDKSNISIFDTKKFGTITIIPKDNDFKKYNYEITPLRQESEYKDNRHPESISRTDDILMDSKRRDFSINCMYYYCFQKNNKIKLKEYILSEKELKFLSKEGYLYIKDLGLCIFQKDNIIKKICKGGKINKDELDNYGSGIDRIIIDPHNGINDLIDGKIKCVGEPDKRFEEDALRLVRALRLPCIINKQFVDNKINKNLDYEKKTRNSIKKNYYLIQFIAKERIHDEIVKVFKKGSAFCFVSLLDEVNILKYLFPSFYQCKNLVQPIRYHSFDVYAHTMLALYFVEKINSDYLVKLAILLHDVGKAEQYHAYDINLEKHDIKNILSGRLNHLKCGLDIAKKDLENLKFSKKEIETILWYIEYHHKPGEILDSKKENHIKKLRKIYSDVGYKRLINLMDVVKGDRLGQFNPMQNTTDTQNIDYLKSLIKDLKKNEGQFTKHNMKINGNDIMKTFSLKPGPKIGELTQKAFERVLNDIKNRNNKEKILQYLKRLSGK